jgi:hypothetical protein
MAATHAAFPLRIMHPSSRLVRQRVTEARGLRKPRKPRRLPQNTQ